MVIKAVKDPLGSTTAQSTSQLSFFGPIHWIVP